MDIKGIVVDENNNPIPGATIFISNETGEIKKPARGEYSDPFGKYYILNVSPNDYLTASFVGQKRETKKEAPVVNFKLASQELPEVEITSKRPFPWLLGIAVVAVTIGAAVFIIDISKKIK